MSTFATTWEIERSLGGVWAGNEGSVGKVDDEVSSEEQSSEVGGYGDQSSYTGSTGSDAPHDEATTAVGFFQGVFG